MMRNITVGIDVGTYATRVAVAEHIKGERAPRIIGTGTTPTRGLRHGYITNIEQATKTIEKALREASKNSGVEIKRVFATVGGIGLESMTALGSAVISKADGEVTQLDIQKAIQAAEDNLEIKNRRILHRLPVGFKLDGKNLPGRPERVKGLKLEIKVLFITCFEQHLEDLLTAIKKTKEEGSRVVLATGTHYLLAQKIADFIGLFDEVIATHDHINMTGENKARELVARYGEKGFIYAGDSRIDAKVWEHAREAWVVNPKWKVEELAVQTVGAEHTRFFPRMVSRPSAFLGALQVGSWVTFFLLFSILVEMGVVKWDLGLLLFVSLCFADSGLSLCNLVVNIEKDRAPSVLKTPGMMDPCFRRDDSGVKQREITNPFAKGYLHLLTGLVWGPIFIIAGFTLSFLCLRYLIPLLMA